MKTRVTLQLIEEAARFDLRYACDDCALFTGEACAHAWPGGERRRELQAGEQIEFCKEFEAV
jgi:hypothetical protein